MAASDLRRLIARQSFSMREAADAAYIGRDTFFRRLRGGGQCFTLDELQALAAALGVPLCAVIDALLL